ncbi:MAG TPA: TetR family transcriptional regulator [Caulobacteraceae bacterium]|jgi:AcrR family transcriptional regulator|nr:TetR family transcriptional regulator [Caulobacteraceae bacterium]
MSVQQAPSQRSAKAAATKAAILRSARRAFADHGYEGAGLRGIAREAGVTAMMVGRYFGSKEALFGEVVADTMRDPVILSPTNLKAGDLPRALADALVGVTTAGSSPLDGFLVLFRSVGSPVAAKIAREQIVAAHHAAATALMPGDHAGERAAVLLSLVAGIQMMRQMIELPALAAADEAVLADILRRLIATVLSDADRGSEARVR